MARLWHGRATRQRHKAGAGASQVPAKRKREAGSGALRQLPSGRWQARFRGPDGVLRSAGTTFDTKLDANAWLKAQARDVAAGRWTEPTEKARVGRLADYAETWLHGRDLKPRTRDEYRRLLDALVLPDLGDVPLDRLTPASVRAWHDNLNKSTPTRRAHAYSLLRAICSTAVADDLVPANPCRLRGAGAAKKQHRTDVASLPEMHALVEAVPGRYQAMLLLAAWCGLRFGELTELRRGDVDLERGLLRVERAVTRVGAEFVVGEPKSDAGRRTVTIPPHLLPVLVEHLDRHTDRAADALLFPSARDPRVHLTASSLHKVWDRARQAAGRPDMHFHDLRHTGATLAAATGATLADLMARLGHSTSAAAMRYQHAAQDRDQAIADALSEFAEAKVVPLRKRETG